jgi:hypothetical protein
VAVADVPKPRGVDRLPVDDRGYPVPWFVSWFSEDGQELDPGHGKPEFRIASRRRLVTAVTLRRCWICGRPTGRDVAFVLGPISAITHATSEPPAHVACAEYAAQVCPFLTHPKARRRTAGMPDGTTDPPGLLRRNPGVALVWGARRSSWRIRHASPDGSLTFDIGPALAVRWFTGGRPSTRAEVQASIDEALPELEAQTHTIEDRLDLAKRLRDVAHLLPTSPEGATDVA